MNSLVAWSAEIVKAVIEKLRGNWKKLYWFGFVAFLSYLVATRFSSIVSGNPTNMDIIIFIIWVALIVVPLFREVNIFGVGLKNEIDSLRNDFRGEMLNLRSEIQNTINLRQQIIVGQVPSDAELRSTEEHIKPVLERTLKELDIKGSVSVAKETKVPTDTQFLFSVRYTIENELKRIWNFVAEDKRRLIEYEITRSGIYPRSIHQIVNGLTDVHLIDYQFRDLIQDIYAICSSAIHGGDVTEAKVKFVREFAPFVMTYLRLIKSSTNSTR